MNISEGEYVTDRLEVTHVVEVWNGEGRMMRRDTSSMLSIPLVVPITGGYGGSNDASARANQVESFLIGLGIPLPSAVRLERTIAEREEARQASTNQNRKAALAEDQRDRWRKYAEALEVDRDARNFAVSKKALALRPEPRAK